MGFFLQLRLLLWKNFTLRKRQPFRVVVEIVWPLVLFLILMAVRFRSNVRVNITECHYEARAMPSAGSWAFLSSYLCSFNNDCQQNISSSDIPGIINTLNGSLLSQFVDDLETVLSSNIDRDELSRLIHDVVLLEEFFEVVMNGTADIGALNVRLSDVLISRQNLTDALANQSIALSKDAVDSLLNASLNLQKVVEAFIDSNRTQLENFITLLEDISRIGATGVPNNATVQEVMNLVCDNNVLLKYFDFDSEVDATNLQDQLCNLSLADITNLVQDLNRDVNQSKVLQEVIGIITNVTGRRPNLDMEFVSLILNIIENINGLSSLNFLLQDLSSATAAASSVATSANDTNLLSTLGTLFCGWNRTLLNMGNIKESALPKSLRDIPGNFIDTNYEQKMEDYKSKGISSECAALFASLQTEREFRILWRQLEPIVLGVINYAPDTPASRAIIKEANRTFDSIANVFGLVESLQNFLPVLENFLENDTRAIRAFFGTPVCKNTFYVLKNFGAIYQQTLPGEIRQMLANLNESICDEVSQFMGLNGSSDPYNWRHALNNIHNMLAEVLPYLKCFNLNKFIGYSNSSLMEEASLIDIDNNTFWSAIFFDSFVDENDVTLPSVITYRIRMDSDKVDSTKRIINKFWYPGNRGNIFDLKYWVFGFIYIQDLIDHAIIRLQTNTTQEPGVYTQQFPYGCYVHDRFRSAIAYNLPIFMVISWIYTVAMIIKGIVYEKEQRLKEVMKIMGLGNGVHWLAWFINSFVMMLITVILFVIILKVGKVLEYSDPSVMFVFMLSFTASTISQCFLISVFFSRANMAAVCGSFIYFVLYLPYTQLVQWDDDVSTTERILASLSSSIAMGYGCSYLSQYEEQTVGAQWHNIGESPMVDDTFNLRTCIGMMFLDSIIYLLLTWYIEAVFPGQYGIPRKWYFIVQKSYWFGSSRNSRSRSRADSEIPIEDFTDHNENFEREPTNHKVGVGVRNLRKMYNKGDRVAVDGLTINFYQGQITSFLGHNGAGKTTTMSILTGLFPPTAGTAYIYGQDILVDMDQIRSNLGICPQHNVLFDLLTVEEHLWFYARLKGKSEVEVKSEIEQMISDVGLPHKCKEKSENLSGGMKRKLSVAIAFVGESRTVILDEPTAGVDPYARRAIWELLLKLKKDRTIILSTHHMDEADVLGDRIAIISRGKLCAVGTSLFLKNRFGSGYYLTLVRQEVKYASAEVSRSSTASSFRTVVDVQPEIGDTNEVYHAKSDADDNLLNPALNKMVSGFSISRLTAFIQKFVPGSVLVEDNSIEVCYRLPEGDNHAEKYQMLFAALESSCSDLGISSYGISDTSLEEVFLKVTEDNSEDVVEEERKKKKEKDAAKSKKYRPSFRLGEKRGTGTGFFRLSQKNRVNSTERLIADTDDTGKKYRPSFRLGEKRGTGTGFFRLSQKNRVNSTERLIADTDDTGKKYRPSFRLGEKRGTGTGFFRLSQKNRVNSTERLIADTDDTESVTSEIAETSEEVNFSGAGQVYVRGKKLVAQQLLALILKRFHHVRRSKKGFVSEILLPAGFVCLAMVFAVTVPSYSEEPALELQPWMYQPKKGDPSLFTFYSNDNPSNPTADALETSLLQVPYFGNRCMNSSLYTISGKPCEAETNSTSTPRPTVAGNLSIDSSECSCDSGFQRCSEMAGGPEPSMLRLRTSDWLYNTTGRNISDWLVKTVERYKKRRYGGFSFGEENRLGRLNSSQISAAINDLMKAANNNQSLGNGSEQFWKNLNSALQYAFAEQNIKVWFNNKGYAASVSYMNAVNNLILRALLPSGKISQNYGIVTFNHPMNLTKKQLNEELINSNVDVVVAICVIFAMSFVPASFVLFLVEERVSSSKHLQFVSGIKPVVYWVANWAWDMVNYAISALLCILIFLAFGKEAYVSSKSFPCLLALLFMYGWSVTPMMYPFSRLFDVPSSAFVALSCVNVFLSTMSTLSTSFLQLLSLDDQDLKNINDILKQVFLILPHYCLGGGLIEMTSYQLQAEVKARLGDPMVYNLFEWRIVGRNLFSMILLGIFFNILNLLIEYKFFISWTFLSKSPAHKTKKEDIDVAREKQRILSGAASDDVMRLEGLTKVYWTPGRKGKMTAVDHLYVGVPEGQCFGLLGVNGAGKTTTFKMLTGDITVTEGDAFINDYSTRKNLVQVRQFMGYCPQFDALDPLLTGREHLEFYARVRGISPKETKSVVDWVIKKLDLFQYRDRISSSYSGGNKRKLSTAIALIGNPPVIFLDEPTAGMDPKARRFLWNCINSIVKLGHSVILTSHSMEECEALCDRLAIMVNGTFQCLGSIQHLKSRFGNGYSIVLRVSGQNPDVNPVMQFISSSFPSARLREKHHNMLQYQLGIEYQSLSKIFQAMEDAKRVYNVEDYSVSQTTLDQVFINFAKKQMDLLDETENNVDYDMFDEKGDDFSVTDTETASAGQSSWIDDLSITESTL